MNDEKLDLLADRLRRATRVTILTGAGVSAASGVPTFRGSGGLWRQFRAEDLATPGRSAGIRCSSGSGTRGVAS